jgi:hypothetical protein
MLLSLEFDNVTKLISLLKFIMNNDLKNTFKESVKVIEIVLTAPILLLLKQNVASAHLNGSNHSCAVQWVKIVRIHWWLCQ